MKKILCSILASTLCFTGSLPVFAGANPVSNSGTSGIAGSGVTGGNGEYNGMSRVKVFITVEGQEQILLQLNQVNLTSLLALADTNQSARSLITLLTGSIGDSAATTAQIDTAQAQLTTTLIALGLDLSDGVRPAKQLVNALRLLIPFGSDATPSDTIGVAAVDGTKLFQAVTAFNQLINQLTETALGNGPDAERARFILQALSEDEAFTAVASTLKDLRDEL